MDITINGRKFSEALLAELRKLGEVDWKGMTKIRMEGKVAAVFYLEYKDEKTLVAHSMTSYRLGAGAVIMRARVAIADRLGLNLFLEVSPYQGKNGVKPLTQEQLVSLYLKQGFKVIGRTPKKVRMLREPRLLSR